jgi:hypothetical protein
MPYNPLTGVTDYRVPGKEALAEARKSRPRHVPATPELREGWSVVNPAGAEIFYGSAEDAANAAATGIY